MGSPDLPPATGAWRPGDDPGRRRFVRLGELALESGASVPDVRMAYETWGTLAPDGGNAVLVLHALTGDSHVAGPIQPGHPTPGWWNGLIGPGRPVDTDRWFVVAPNILGGCQGTTGPADAAPDGRPWGSRFPTLTTRDQVAAEQRLADELGIDTWACVLGGSAGGMRALEWAVDRPERVRRRLVLATAAAASADQIGWCHAQIAAIAADGGFRGGDYYDAPAGDGPHRGLAVARQIAHLTYRCEPELQARFGRSAQTGQDPALGGRFAVESYLAYHGDKLARRFDANSYITLTRAMNSHDVGRGRGGVVAALARVSAVALIAGVDSDRLYPLVQQQQLADHLPGADGLHVVHSGHGHDGFLIELEQVGALVAALLEHPA